MKTSATAYLALLIGLFGITDSKVEVCLRRGSTYDSQNTDNSRGIGELFERANNELATAIKKSKVGGASSFNYTNFHLYINHSAVTLNGSLTNGSVFIDDQSFRLFTFISKELELFNLTFPSIYINSSYDLKGYIGHKLFNIYGIGNFHLQLINFSISVVTSLEVNSTAFCIPVTVKLNVGDCKSFFANIMDGDEELEPLINGVLQAIVPDAIEIIFREDADYVDPFIQWIIDRILNLSSSKSLAKLLHLISTDTDLAKSARELQQKRNGGNWTD